MHIDTLAKAKGDPGVDLARYEDEEGKEVTLRGLTSASAASTSPTSPTLARLGHLHHLEADNGKIYNYLQYGDGKAAFLGDGTHFKNVELKRGCSRANSCWSSAASSCRDHRNITDVLDESRSRGH